MFWYALVMLIHVNHPKAKTIKDSRKKLRETLGKELCNNCGFEWDKPISLDDISTVEEQLKINILVFDIDKIPILRQTRNIYDSLM